MAKLSLALAAALAASATAFAPSTVGPSTTALSATGYEETGGEMWDPLGLYNLEDAADTFPNMFPKSQFIEEAEIKHGRMAMLGWTGVWATHVGGMGLGLHFPGFPVESDWTKALGVFAAEEPAWFGAILMFIAIAEGESVGHSGDNWRNMSTKEPGNPVLIHGAILMFIAIAEGESVGHSGDNWRNMSTKEPGNLGFDPWGLKAKLSDERQEYYKIIEKKNGRAAMIAMASLFSMEAIPGSVPVMDILS
eukprot:CAMPEP_0203661444 /NCGR_PEP_ID=MMETSP0088-20131115/59608_1 /ASSEMBLY_ACC=CAM_ASM_001087 /TAXON_ID=426623 /ORGANISM="Chaetoceros affinis, Strain CCMP159" /LENGTH=249 /DNA_ID=CAMNT_0050524119 /DNA_START=99 /DNA_END=848 /DNA_ORIENTATION=+